jgi:hypothetical protein
VSNRVDPANDPSAPGGAARGKGNVRLLRSAGAAERHQLRVQPVDDRSLRRTVAWVTGLAGGACVGLAVATLMLKQPLVRIPFGSGLAVELVLERWPDAYVAAAVHLFALATIAFGLLALSTVAHTTIPGQWNHPHVLVFRRRSRYIGTELVACTLLLVGGLALRDSDWRLPAALLEGAATWFLIRASAILWVPSARAWLVVVFDPSDGIGNFWAIGGGVRGLLAGPQVLCHEDLVNVSGRPRLLEVAGGYAGLSLIHTINRDERTRTRVRLDSFVSLQQMAPLMTLLNQFRVARSRDSLKSPFNASLTLWSRWMADRDGKKP